MNATITSPAVLHHQCNADNSVHAISAPKSTHIFVFTVKLF